LSDTGELTSCAACSGAATICPPSGDLNSHPELSTYINRLLMLTSL